MEERGEQTGEFTGLPDFSVSGADLESVQVNNDINILVSKAKRENEIE